MLDRLPKARYNPRMSLEHHASFICPYCGRSNGLAVDVTGGSDQEFVVDCETCCAPIVVTLRLSGDEIIALETRREND